MNLQNKNKDKSKEGHYRVIMAMVAMPKLQFLASAGLDSYLIIWDTINQQKKRVFREHRRGIHFFYQASQVLHFTSNLSYFFPRVSNTTSSYGTLTLTTWSTRLAAIRVRWSASSLSNIPHKSQVWTLKATSESGMSRSSTASSIIRSRTGMKNSSSTPSSWLIFPSHSKL